MRESPQDFFLNNKARFQISSDIEDAAALYFACHNLINNGLDFDWDSTLQKMEDLLKEQEVEVDHRLKDGPREKAISAPVHVPPIYADMKPPPTPRKESEGMGTDPYRRGSSSPTSKTPHRSFIPDSTPSGQFGTKQACHGNGSSSPYNKLMEDYHDQLKSSRYPLAHEKNLPALRELMSDRASHNDDATLPDEFALLNLFIENSSKPILYDHLQQYYNPKSPFFCGKRDKELDEHAEEVLKTHLPTGYSAPKGVVHFGEIDSRKEGTQRDEAKLYSFMEDIGHLSPNVIGQQAKEMRFRLYERRYQKWLHGYDEKFPESTLRDSQKRERFLEHLALELDGVPEDTVWNVLYSGKGEVLKGGYLSIANSEGYDEMRDKSKQIGNYALEHELVMLPFDDMVEFMHIFHQMAARDHAKDFMSIDEENGVSYLLPVLPEYQTKVGRRDEMKLGVHYDDGGEVISYFGDGGPGVSLVPFSPTDIYRFGKQMRVVNKDSQYNYWTSPQDVQHNERRHIIRAPEADYHKRLFARMLREAHGYSREVGSSRAGGGRDAGRVPIYKFVKNYYAGQWDDIFDVPDIPLNSMSDVHIAIDNLRELDLSASLVNKMERFVDREYYGVGAETKPFQNRRAAYLRILSPWIDALDGVDVNEHDSTTGEEKSLPSKKKMGPFYHHRVRHTTTGGLGKERQDPICIMGQRYPHEYIALEPKHTELSDIREMPKPTDKDYEAFIEGLGEEIGPEFDQVLRDQHNEKPLLNISDMRHNPKYPILSRYLEEIWPESSVSEGQLQSSHDTVGGDDTSSDEDTPWQKLDLEGLLSLALIRHTGMLTDERIKVPYGHEKLSGSLRGIRFFQLPKEVAKGSLGYIPSNRASWSNSLTVTPHESAIFIVKLQDVMNISRIIPPNQTQIDKMSKEELEQFKAWQKNVEKRLLTRKEYKVPRDVTSQVSVGKETGKFVKHRNTNHQARVNAHAKLFSAGGRFNRNTSANHPDQSGRMRLNFLQNDGVDRPFQGGDGHATSWTGGVGASFTHRREGLGKEEQNLALRKTLDHKFRASLWGMGGTVPLHYENGVTVLEHPGPFLEMLQDIDKHGIQQHFLEHGSKFFEEGSLNNFFASLAGKRGKGAKQDYGIMPGWREAVTSGSFVDEDNKEISLPEHYYYPVIRSGGQFYLELEPTTVKGEGHIFTPKNFLHEGATTPMKEHWDTAKNVVDGKSPTLLDTALFLGDDDTEAMVDLPEHLGAREWEKKHKELTESDTVAILPSCIVKRPDGTFAAIGPHPAAFAGLWSDHLLAHPKKPGLASSMREARDELIGAAKERVDQDVTSRAGGIGPDNDILYRAGVNKGDLHLMIRDEVNLFTALQHSWPLVVANAAINEYKGSELSLDEMISKFEDEHLKIGPDYPNVVKGDDHGMMEETSRRRAIAHGLREEGYHFMQGDTLDMGHRKNILLNIYSRIRGTDAEDKWKSILGDAGITIKDGAAYFDYKSASNYHDYRIRSTSTFTQRGKDSEGKEYSHPLRRVSEETMTKDVTGHDILSNYLDPASPHRHISQVLEGIGIDGEMLESLNKSIELLKKRHGLPKDLPEETSVDKNMEYIKDVGHHVERQEPLHWHKEQDKNKTSTGATHKEMKFRERGRYARLSAALKSYFRIKQATPEGQSELFSSYGPLFKKPVAGRAGGSIMNIIARDLATAKDANGNLAFPEHANTLRAWNDRLSNSEKFDMLADFFHSRGKFANVVDKKEVIRTPVKPVPIGDNVSDDGMYDISRSKLPCHPFNYNILAHFGDGESLQHHPLIANLIAGSSLDSTPMDVPESQWPPWGRFESVPAGDPNVSEILQSFDVLTDMDLIYKEDKEEGRPIPVKAMHRIFSLEDLDTFKGLSGDWVLSSWPKGERVMVSKKGKRVSAYNSEKDSISLPSVVREGVRAAHKANFIVDCLWDGEILHLLDIIKAGEEDLGNNATKDRVRHLRANFSATEEVLIPAPINTKRVDTEGLSRAVKDLFKEKGVKQVMLRDADSTYMRGESRHPKWLLMTKEHQLDVIVLDVGGACLLGVGPLLADDAKRLGNRAVKHEGDYYMDVGTITKPGLEVGQCVTIKTSNVTAKGRDNLKVFTVRGPKYLKDAETNSTDSLQTLSLLSGEKNVDVPHNVRVSKGSIHIDLPSGHVVYDTEPYGHSFIVKAIDSPNLYLETLAESQRDYWEPVAAVLLRAEIETKKAKKANVVPEPPANHDKKPKKVLKPSERLLKDPELAKQLTTALESIEGLLKEKITWTGPKGLGIDFATPVESPSGPTENTEGYNLPDHDPGHRQEKGGDCWCGAKKGEDCKQGMGHKAQDCPEFSLPGKEEDKKHIKIPVS